MTSIKIAVDAVVTEPGFVTEAQVKSMLADANAIYSSIDLTFHIQ